MTNKVSAASIRITGYQVRASLCRVARLQVSTRPASPLFGAGNSKTARHHTARAA